MEPHVGIICTQHMPKRMPLPRVHVPSVSGVLRGRVAGGDPQVRTAAAAAALRQALHTDVRVMM